MESNTLDNFICPICGTKLLWMPVSHIFVCEGCRETFSKDAKSYLHNYDEYIASKKSHGNAAAMREALMTIRKRLVAAYVSESEFMRLSSDKPLVDLIDAALSAPARNCDRFNTGDVKRDAQNAMEAILNEGVAGYRGIAEYLLSPVCTEQKGEGDGNK